MKVELVEHGGQISDGAASSRASWRERRGLLLRLREGDVTGLGEASPLLGYSADALETARSALESWTPPALDLSRPLAGQLRSALETLGGASPAARFAAETALLDLAGCRLGEPLWRLLAPEARPRPAAVAALLTAPSAEGAVAQGRAAFARGLRTFKLKVGAGTHERDLKGLAALRGAFGEAVRLRLDANGTLPADEALERLAAFARFGPELIEEPVPLDVLLDWQSSPVPIAVDESLQAADAWERLEAPRRRGLVRSLVLKPMALGGALACLDLAHRAAAEGIAAFVTHLFDGPVALAAARHLALVLPGERLACGLDRHPGLEAWPAFRLPSLRAGEVVPSPGPGLGVFWNGETP